MLMFLVYIAVPLAVLYYLLTNNNGYWEAQGVPHEKPFLMFGSFFSTFTRKEHMSACLDRIYNNFKSHPYVGVVSFNKPFLIIRSPEIIKQILVKDFNKFANRGLQINEKVDPVIFHGMFSATDHFWKNVRSKISPVFTSGKMKLMLPLVKQSANDLSTYLQNNSGKEIDVKTLSKRFTVDVICSCAFGINSNCINQQEKNTDWTMAVKLLNFENFARSLAAFCAFFAPKLLHLLRLTIFDTEAEKYFTNVFSETYNDRKKLNLQRNDLIDLLHNMKDNSNLEFNDIQMVAQAITFFTAGNDTTATALTYSLYELAKNEEVQNRLREEITKAVETDGELTYENIQKMKYLDMVISETLRKYPVLPILNRISAENYKIEETGYVLEKDVSIMISVSALHYDPQYWPNPQKFDPERFSDENKSNIVPYTYMPFGDGPRRCIGERFGLMVAKTGLASIIKDFKVAESPSTPKTVEYDPGALFVHIKGPLPLQLSKVQ